MKLSRLIRIALSCLTVSTATACSEAVGPGEDPNGLPGASPTGMVNILLTDAPSDDLDSAFVYVSQVYLQADSGRVPISDTPAVFELLSLQNGVTAEMGAAALPTGSYSELRLVVDSARAVLRPGLTFQGGSSSATMKVPGGSTSGIKVKYDGTISVGEEATTLVVDFDVSRSFVFQGPPGSPKSVSLKPVLRATRGDEAGSIAGTVAPAEAGATLYALGPESDTVATAVADAESGEYRITFLPPGTYNVFAAAEGYVTSATQEVVVAKGQSVTGVDFELEADEVPVVEPGSISGSVQPAGIGATVYLTAGSDTVGSATPDATSGAYTFDGLDAGTYAVIASAQGYSSDTVDGIVVAAGAAVTGVDLTLTVITSAGVTTVQVLITDAPADILDSAWVFISQAYLQGEGGRTVVSDEPAAFELLSLQGGLTASIGEADLPSGQYSQLRLVVDSARAVLKPGYSFADGSSSASMKVPSGQSSGFKVMFDGPFEITGETVVIVIDFDVSRSFVFQGPKNAPKSVMLKPVLRATYRDVASSISGTVEPASAGASVFAVNSSGDTIATAAADSESGAYMLSFLPPGTYTVIADADGFEPAEVNGVVLGEKEDLTGVDFVLVEQGSISGTVTPPESAATLMALMGDDTVAVAEADPETGAYTLEGLNQGTYTVIALADGFLPAEMADVVVGPAEDVTGVDFDLVAYSSISGTVTPLDVGAQVMAMVGDDTVAVADVDAETGAYILEGLIEGTYTVIASAAGFLPAEMADVLVGPAEDVVGVDFELVAYGSISGTVNPLGIGAQVVAMVGDDTVSVAEVDAETGAYVLEGLVEGTYTVVASADGYQPAEVTDVVVGPEEDVTGVDFTLTAS